ncbi:mutual gliding protein B [Deferribacter desulfuricans SSM1]|uniref:Mutual gliding protein B n=1 Tax=Deferribacter desulfuricans (strain DSM 14783 / JCM 11476 / NBRC 101012 / SSM1) TaxID=639282 RepID=D3PAB4_DEFDS|nr:roadblock/LC7 domain-containing protein [Deferribacter desulfuricans]BAI79537.1 mutual gliding protein B [Deferribacter desulfuricans SSM1]
MDNFYLYLSDELKNEIELELNRLKEESNSKAVFLLDKNGQIISNSKNTDEYDKDSLGALIAGNVAATGGLAKLLGEKEFSILFHEGENEHIHINLIDKKFILVVIFDESTSLGLVRLRVKKTIANLLKLINKMKENNKSENLEDIFSDINEEDIEKLFKGEK